jgi:hypothetical protein
MRSSRNISGVTLGGERQRQLGVSAPGVEHIAAGLAGRDQRGQFRLRLSDIPRRQPLEDVRLPMQTVAVHHFVCHVLQATWGCPPVGG